MKSKEQERAGPDLQMSEHFLELLFGQASIARAAANNFVSHVLVLNLPAATAVAPAWTRYVRVISMYLRCLFNLLEKQLRETKYITGRIFFFPTCMSVNLLCRQDGAWTTIYLRAGHHHHHLHHPPPLSTAMLPRANVHAQLGVQSQMSGQGTQKLHAAIPLVLPASVAHRHESTSCPLVPGRLWRGVGARTAGHHPPKAIPWAIFNEAQSLECRNFSDLLPGT